MRELRITEVPVELHRALKQAALDNDTTMREIVFQLLRDGLKDFVKKPEELIKVKRRKLST